MRTAGRSSAGRLRTRALSGWLVLALVVALGWGLSSHRAAAAAKGDNLVVTQDAVWHTDPGVATDVSVPAGDDVVVLGGPTDGEYFVAWGGDRGWIDADALAPAGSASGDSSPGSSAADGSSGDTSISGQGSGSGLTEGELAGTTVHIAHAENGARLRAEPSHDGEVVETLPLETRVELRTDETDTVLDPDGTTRWWPVRADGHDGWVAGFYLAAATDSGDTGNADTTAPAASNVDQGQRNAARFAAGDYAAAETASGKGVNIRADAAPDADKVGFIAGGDVVQILDGPAYDNTGNGWYKVTDGSTTGFAAGDLLVAAQPAAPAAPQPAQDQTQTQAAAARSGPTGGFVNPVPGATLTQGYGCTQYSFEPYDAALGCHFHNAVDLAAPAYSPIMAAAGGTVTYAGWCDCGLGFIVEIDHGNGFSTVYGHMAEQPYVSVGQTVGQGEVIGPIGSTGNSTGPHCHFMIKQNGNTVDPLGYISV